MIISINFYALLIQEEKRREESNFILTVAFWIVSKESGAQGRKETDIFTEKKARREFDQ